MTPTTEAADGVVRALLFISPTCPHCREVREEVLPPLCDRFGPRLQVAVLSTATPSGRDLYWAAFRRYGVQLRGVPLLVVGDFALVGSLEIPQRLPDLISSYQSQGGVDWPDLPGLGEVLAASTSAPTPAPLPTPFSAPTAPVEPATAGPPATAGLRAEPLPVPEAKPAPVRPAPVAALPRPKPASTPTSATPGSPPGAAPVTGVAGLPPSPALPAAPPMLIAADAGEGPSAVVARILADPQGNALAILVLAGMVAAVLRSVVVLRRPHPAARTSRLDWLNPLLALAGFGVAAYLAHVEVREIEAVCGPVGDCNTVQQSEYARLFGVIPIGVLGVLGFASILVAWGVRRWGAGQASARAALVLLTMTGLGTLFSIYLTFLEPFVIGATCLWCLSSAVIMTTLYGLALPPGPSRGRWGHAFRVDAPGRGRTMNAGGQPERARRRTP